MISPEDVTRVDEWVKEAVAQGATLDEARTRAHAEAAKVDFDGSQRRSDIAYKNM